MARSFKQKPASVIPLVLSGGVLVALAGALLVWLPDLRDYVRPNRIAVPDVAKEPAEAIDAQTSVAGATGSESQSVVDDPAFAMDRASVKIDPPPAGQSEAPIRPTEISGVKTISELPLSEFEVASAHTRAGSLACNPLAQGKPFEDGQFLPVEEPYISGPSRISLRRHLFSVGLTMREFDRRDLPRLSAPFIMSYFNQTFLSIQAEVCKDPLDGSLYLHHRPSAGAAKYYNPEQTDAMDAGIAASLKNYRSLGLFVPEGAKATPDNLRTLVILNKSATQEPSITKQVGVKDNYEFVFVRARENNASVSKRLDIYTVVTSSDRAKWHLVRLCAKPRAPVDCSLCDYLKITKYDASGLRPLASASCGSTVIDSREADIEALDAYASSQGWENARQNRLTELLDAFIDGKIAERTEPTPSAESAEPVPQTATDAGGHSEARRG